VDTTIGWVSAPLSTAGQDHLATRVVSENLYARLLPGITNVTDRARAWSFYPWFFWAWKQAGLPPKGEDVIAGLRRAECLWTLIALRHEEVTAGQPRVHGQALVGRDQLGGALSALGAGQPVELEQYATEEEGRNRYFKRTMGGLAQYYLGALTESKVLTRTGSHDVRCTAELGQRLAGKLDVSVDRAGFLEALAGKTVDAATLDSLSDFCPCCCPAAEGPELRNLFFGNPPYPDVSARRRSLLLLLDHLQHAADEGQGDDVDTFLGAAYSGARPGGAPWPGLEATGDSRMRWAVYVTSELLSYAVQSLFFAGLARLEEDEAGWLDGGREYGAWFAGTFDQAAGRALAAPTFAAAVARARADLPPRRAWSDPGHEWATRLALKRAAEVRPTDTERVVEEAVRLLVQLCARDATTEHALAPFAPFPPTYLRSYPVNLETLRAAGNGTWAQLGPDALLGWLARRWGLGLHLRVGLRKLRGQSRDTFRARYEDGGLRVVAAPSPAFGNPRVLQARQILLDVGAMELLDGRFVPSDTGRTLLGRGA
jgi:hypothetical protein